MWVSTLHSQGVGEQSSNEVRDDAEKKYGPVSALVNGVKYYYPYLADIGDPFFKVEEGDGLLTAVLDQLREMDIQIYSAEGQPPSLEEVFAHYTGQQSSVDG